MFSNPLDCNDDGNWDDDWDCIDDYDRDALYDDWDASDDLDWSAFNGDD